VNWRFAAANTHLHPGARLRCIDTVTARRLAAGDAVAVEFSDGGMASARIAAAAPDAAVLSVEAHRTARGTQVAARSWRIVPAGEAGSMRVQARVAK
jgi:hypothetical protein